MKCNKVTRLLSKYIDQELSADVNDQIRVHLDTCKKCKSIYSRVKDSMKLLQAKSEISEQAFYYTRLKQNMENKIHTENSFFKLVLSKKIIQPVIYLSSLILAVYIGILIGSGSVTQNSYAEISNNDVNYIETFKQYQYFDDLDIEPIENLILSDNSSEEN